MADADASRSGAGKNERAKRHGWATVLVADDSMAIREVIAQMIEAQPHLQLAGRASDGLEALDIIERERPDILVVDVQMPRLDGIATTAAVKERWPETKVVVFTTSSDQGTIGRVFSAGADAYVCKHDSWERLVDCLEALRRGDRIVSLVDPQERTLKR